MRIGLNLLFLIPGEVGGTETYSTSLITALGQIDQENQYYLLINRESRNIPFPSQPNFHRVICPIKATNRWIRFLWEQSILPLQAKVLRLDLLHSLGYISPLILPCKSITTVHDLNFVSIPQFFSPFVLRVQKFFVEQTVKHVDHVIVVSEFVRDQLSRYLPADLEKISVIHEAPKQRNKEEGKEVIREDICKRYGIKLPYIVAFSSLTPHKNITGLLEVFARIVNDLEKGWQLVVVGHLPRTKPPLPEYCQNLGLNQGDAIFTGYLPDDQVSVMLTHADLFVFPSFYEGFGLPLLEAMNAGVPVVCSSRGSLPEIAGDAAIFFDPADSQDMAGAILSVIRDISLRRALRERGKVNLERFSWEKAAQKTLEVYKRVGTPMT